MEPKCVHVACGFPSPVLVLVFHDDGLRASSASSPEFCFVARTRRGLEAALRSELQRFVPHGHVSNGLKIVAEDTEVTVAETEGSFIAPEGKEAEGAVEILGPWRNIYWILRSSLVQSVLASYFTEFSLRKSEWLGDGCAKSTLGRLHRPESARLCPQGDV